MMFKEIIRLLQNHHDINPIQDGMMGAKRLCLPFFPYNFYKRKNQPKKLSDFQFQPFCYIYVKVQGCTQDQSHNIKLEVRTPMRNVATNNGLSGGRGGRFRLGPFLYRKCKRGIKVFNVFYCANNKEHNIKQNIFTGIKIISVAPP